MSAFIACHVITMDLAQILKAAMNVFAIPATMEMDLIVLVILYIYNEKNNKLFPF